VEKFTTDAVRQQLRKEEEKYRTLRLEQFRSLLHHDKERISEEEQRKKYK
jgi:hypothetical protein